MNSYKSGKGVTTTYSYYADDMRKSKKVENKNEITQIWIDDDIALETENGNVRSRYVYGDKLICSSYGWYLYNEHGDVTALTANNGSITKNYKYNSFGVQKSETDDTDENPYRYSGEYYDAESGYTYLQARYYDPNMGRFISEDPAMDGDNWYVYCGNDPINMVDPTGMWYGSIHKEISEYAFNHAKGILNKSYAKDGLLDGCTVPDDEFREKNKWHGHKGYAKIMEYQIFKARKKWRQGKKFKNKQKRRNKYRAAYYELGKGLHTIQDFYAHNVELNGKIVSSRKVATGHFKVKKDKISLEYGWVGNYVTEQFISKCNGSKKIKNGDGVHGRTADNAHAYFDGKKWVWTTKGSNPRLKKAKKNLKSI